MVDIGSRSFSEASDGWFEKLYGETYGEGLAYARRLVGKADADDVVQEAFLRLARYKPAGGEHIGIKFVMAVVKNTAMNLLAKRSRDTRQSREGRHGWCEYSERNTQATGTSTGWAREQLEALPASHREAFVLVEVMGLSESQAGLAMHLSRPVVGQKKRCATEALRNKAKRLDGVPHVPVMQHRLNFPHLAHRCA